MPEPTIPPAKVTTRVELILLLSQAAELEHSLMCQYLFTAFTLKQPGDAGIGADQTRMIQRWFGTIMHIAVEEMRHLAQVCNLLTAVGGAPMLRHGGFPRYASSYTLGLEAKLAAFSLETIRRYVCWEKPEGEEEPGCGQPLELAHLSPAGAAYCSHLAQVESLIPEKRPYRSIGELYALIDSAFSTIPARSLFIGPKSAQITNSRVPFREPLTAITTPHDARRAIHLIVVEGEGTPHDVGDAHRDTSHFARFLRIATDLERELQRDPSFAPARPVIENPVYAFSHQIEAVAPGANLITNGQARQIGAIFTAAYDLTFQILMRFFVQTDENDQQQQTLVDAGLSLMTGAIRPLGLMLTQLPAGDPARGHYPGLCAGPSFEVYCQVQPIPHLHSAWLFFRERLGQIANDCQNLSLSGDQFAGLAAVAALLQFWAGNFRTK